MSEEHHDGPEVGWRTASDGQLDHAREEGDDIEAEEALRRRERRIRERHGQAVMGGQPGPGWWLASDGKLYPPEAHPDVAPPLGGSPPVQPPAPPTQRSDSKRSARSAWFGAAIAVTFIALLGASAFTWTRVASRLPSPQADLERIEAALPQASELPPGLVEADDDSSRGFVQGGGNPQDDGDSSRDEGACDFLNVLFPGRAAANVEFMRPESWSREGVFGEGGLVAFAGSFDAPVVAEQATDALTAPLFTTCIGLEAEGFRFIETTGGVVTADQVRVLALEGAWTESYVVIARTGRFLTVVFADTADYALEWAETIVERLQ